MRKKLFKRCKWCGKWILPFTKEVDGMHPKCKRDYQAWEQKEVSIRCSNGHLFTVQRKEIFEECPICGRRMYPAWWFDSAYACINNLNTVSVE